MSLNLPLKLDPRACGAALADPDSYAFTLLTVILGTFPSEEIFGDDDNGPVPVPLLFNLLEEKFGVRIPISNENRIQAALFLLTSGDAFFTQYEAFTAVCQALALGEIPDLITGNFTSLTPVAVLWGLLETKLLLDVQTEDPQFHPSILQLILDTIEASPEEVQEIISSPMDEGVRDNLERLVAQVQTLVNEESERAAIRTTILSVTSDTTSKFP